MRAWTRLLGLGNVSGPLSKAPCFLSASSRRLQPHHAFSSIPRLLPSGFLQLQQVAGLRTIQGRPKARPRLPYAVYALPKKPIPKRVYPLKVTRSWKPVKEATSQIENPLERSWVDVPRGQESTEELEKELAWLANNHPASLEIPDILRELVEKRGLQPSSTHYEALILSNCDPEHGSVKNVEVMLKEIEQAGIAMNASLYGAVLKVLAVHTDSVLRQHVVDEMDKHWMATTPDTRHAVIAGMIREDQLELAQEKMNEMGKPPTWLYVLFTHALCDQKDFEAVLHLTYSLQDQHIDLPRPTWLYILQQASNSGHYDLTKRVWLYHVEPMYIVPDVDCCVRALKLASQRADPKLAESALAVIEDRYPEEADKRKHLVDLAYRNAGQPPDPRRYRKGNMFALLSKGKGHHQAFFDPKVAIAKRPLPRFFNPKRLQRKRLEKLSSKRR